ncbi:hypothetical protein N657DRAFT_572366 [Parathielavia appendiculata]|uniref:Kinetochore-associated protein MTW1 n=1 Tax=Parathielavia appendiculata TaxID=2587402 RepID=A0AAN6Z2V4_9PEZI|nr:hypothetical protein N657DRAFT_572366 [Parathielavia appendiculata]
MASRSDTELLTEHFGYPPVSLLDEIINSINFLAERALHSIEQGLLNAPPVSLGFRPSSKHAPRQHHQQQNAGAGGIEDEEETYRRRHREEIETGTHQLETLLWASIDKNFDRFEIYVMRNILCLRPGEMEWLRLGHYDGLVFPAANRIPNSGGQQQDGGTAAAGGDGQEEEGVEEDDRLSAEGINHLRRRLQASQRLHSMLVAERARNAALLGEMRRLVGGRVAGTVKTEPVTTTTTAEQQRNQHQQPQQQEDPQQQEQKQIQQKPPFQFLHSKGHLTDGDATTPLTTTTAFSLSQLQALRDLSRALRNAMPSLASLPGEDDEDVAKQEEDEVDGKGKKKSWRRERLEYVETATKRHLENVRGLELGQNGEVRDGEWDGGGRRLAKGEVESLERVVGLLGRVEEEGERMDES